MAEFKGIDILDLLIFLFQRKRLLSIMFLSSFVITYLVIYVVVDEQYSATATIIPSDDESGSGLSGMLKGLKGLPINLGGSSSKTEINRYRTIIYSRTVIEEIIGQFGLYRVYKIDTTNKEYRELAIKRLRKEIITEETDEGAFEITAYSNDPQRAADIVNVIVRTLNDKIIQLKVSKSKENRIFLEKRVKEITRELYASEDSLKRYQEASGLFDVKSQIPEIMSVYSTLESELMLKKLKKNISENLFDKESPEVRNLEIEIREYQRKLDNLRSQGEQGGLMLAMKALPNKSLEYVRRFRQVTINSTLLEFIVPLYEQAKLDEKKDYPILQIIDNAIPPAKKSWPPRTLFSLLGAFFTVISYLLYLFLSGIVNQSQNHKIILLRNEVSEIFSRKKHD